MKTPFEKMKELLAGVPGDQADEVIRKQLADPNSDASLFFAGATAAAQNPLVIDWDRIVETLAEIEFRRRAAK